MTSPTATAYERLVDRVRDQGRIVRDFGSQARAECPSHENHNPTSLSIYRKPGKVKIVCWVGCDDRDVLAALGLGVGDLYDDPLQQRSPRAPHLHLVPRIEPPKSLVDRALQRLLSLPDLGERLCLAIARDRPELYIFDREQLGGDDDESR